MSGYECPKCHRGFAGLAPFDAHQDVDYSRPHGDMVHCQDPAPLGMRQNRWGLWGRPLDRPLPPKQPISAGRT